MPANSSKFKYYTLSAAQSLKNLESSEKGLALKQVKKRKEKWGENKIPEKQRYNPIKSLINQFKSPLVYILFFAALISYYFNHLVDVYVIGAVILVNSLIGFIQEYKAEKSMEALKKLVVQKAKVTREGELIEINAKNLVPGDILVLEEGDKVPADARLINLKNLQAVEASLTGESMPVNKTLKSHPFKTTLADRKNMVFMGTFISRGSAKAIVTQTGRHTALGKIATDITNIKKVKSHFEIKTEKLATFLGIGSILGSIVIFGVGFFIRNFEFSEIFLFTVASLVSAIPEGLPAILSIVLAVGSTRLANKNAIIRKLSATETLGVVTTIATDKTGTLTKNIITTQKVILANGREIDITGTGWESKGDFVEKGNPIIPTEDKALSKLLHISSICNNTKLVKKGKKQEIIGDPTEASLIVLAQKAGIEKQALLKSESIIDEIPFNSEQKYRASLIKNEKTKKNEIYILGAPEIVLSKSSKLYNSTKNLNKNKEKDIKKHIEKLSTKAMRVLAVAVKNTTKVEVGNEDINNLTFIGIVGMIDPPREEATEAIKKAHLAGTRVIMTTGDHKETAIAIAKEIGLTRKDKKEFPEAYTGRELEELDSKEFEKVVLNVNVFARLTPSMKMKITDILQKNGEIVAMTGDGVNDAPALRKADIGIAMGITGTDVARESAEIILRDDNFASIVEAIEEGRIIFNNIRRSTSFLVTTNIAEYLTILLSLLTFQPLPVLPTQVLWLNLVTDSFPGISLSFEKGHGTVLTKKPRDKNEEIISKDIFPFLITITVIMVTLTFGIFLYYLDQGVEKARTYAFTALAFTQLFNVYNMRSFSKSIFKIGIFSNKYINIGLITSTFLTVLAVFVPFLKNALGFNGINIIGFLVIIAMSSVVLWTGELYKLIKKKHK